MKKLMMTAAVVAMFFAVSNVYAQTKKIEKAPSKVQEIVQNEFQKVKVSQLPDAVKEAVMKDFKDAEITKAYMNKEREFKLILKAEGVEAKTVYANSKGEWIKPTA